MRISKGGDSQRVDHRVGDRLLDVDVFAHARGPLGGLKMQLVG
jgi:hypothetical protein